MASKNRYNYKEQIPKGMEDKRDRIAVITKDHGTDIITAAMHFVLASD
jgi:D-threo-aldose 1-dehydrogenase